MTILGLNSYFFSSSACLVEGGRILSAVQDERLVRRKFSSGFPFDSVGFCLKQNGLKPGDIDTIAFPADLAIYLEHLNRSQMSSIRYRGELGYALADGLISLHGAPPSASSFAEEWQVEGKKQKLFYINHHLAHAAQSFFLSPFERAAILVMDGFGEKACQLMALGEGTQIQPLGWVDFPHTLGRYYATFTEFLGFRPDSDEWKLMGASSYGNPERFYPALSKLIQVREGKVELDLSYFNFYQFHRPCFFSPKMAELIGPPRQRDEELTAVHFDLAAAVQKVTEDVVFEILAWLRKTSGCDNLCLGGGVFQNSVLNGKIKERTGFKGLYIPSAPDDSGGSVGAALYQAHHVRQAPRETQPQYNYWGPGFTDQEIEESLKLWKMPFMVLREPAKTAARIIRDGQILGWFQGNIEFGDRALGNRSILADPRNPAMKDQINARVKFREEFRPFAPSILAERVSDYFVDAEATPFMEKVYPIKPSRRAEIPAVTHVDGTGRLQTVSQDQNPLYYELIGEFERLTGTPVVLNTSFNINHEPIVATPHDAVRTFSTCGMDFLILGRYLVAKNPLAAKAYET